MNFNVTIITVKFSGLLFLGLAAFPCAAAVSVDKLTGEAYSDMGQIVHGYNATDNAEAGGSYLMRLGVSITATDTLKGSLRISAGVGGLFWQPFPTSPGEFWKNNLQFGPGITVASAEFLFTPGLALEGGYFPFKYNPPAMDLGEYLLRSESYPTYLSTGGWTWVDSAYTRALGIRLRASHFDGKFRHEAGLYWEFQNPPLYDVTPAYLFAWEPIKGFEIGGGAALKRWFSNNLSFLGTDPKAASARRYVEIANFPEVQNQAMVRYTYADGTGKRVADSAFTTWRPGSAPDFAAALAGKNAATVTNLEMIQQGSPAGTRAGIERFLMNAQDCDATGENCTPYYDAKRGLIMTDAAGDPIPGSQAAPVYLKREDITRKAINLMGRLDVDFAKLFGLGETTGPFKLYAEAAVLGARNQPVYYEHIADRIPLMIGMHLPTFGLFDLLAVETEYLRNPYQDSEQGLDGGQYGPLPGQYLPIPDLAASDYDKRMFTVPDVHGDDRKWSVHVVKTVLPGVKVKLQAANDHLRLDNYEALPSPVPQTYAMNHWYYLVHLQWGF